MELFLIIKLLKIWIVLEFINWISYLLMYINIISPKFKKFKEVDTQNIINRLDKLSKDEIEYVIAGCVVYNKLLHTNITIEPEKIKDMSKTEIINLIGYSLFGLNISDIYISDKLSIINKLILTIEDKLGYKFKLSNEDRFLYRKWGSNFIQFSFRPLALQIPMKIIVWIIHLVFTLYLGFKWTQTSNIGFLTNISDPSRKTILFIHGIGFGYIPYIQILMELNKKYNLIIVVLPNISVYNYYGEVNYSYFPPIEDLSNSLYNFLEINKLNNLILLSHSFGTYVTQIIRKDKRNEIFNKIILVDPIIFWIGCFKMSLHVDNPFIKKYPIIERLLDNLISFLIYQCLYLKYVLFRVMFGPDFWIYDAKELSNTNITIVLEKNDYIIPAELLYNKIKNYVKCYYFDSDNMTHGTILMEKKYIGELISIIED